jgi:hypothetical protein
MAGSRTHATQGYEYGSGGHDAIVESRPAFTEGLPPHLPPKID